MSINNPDILTPLLHDLVDQLIKWNERASSIAGDAERLQQLANSLINDVRHNIQLAVYLAEEDRQLVEHHRGEVEKLLDACKKEKDNAQLLKNEGEIWLGKAEKTLKYWESALEKALQWLVRAEERLRLARIDLANAENELQAARNQLAEAEHELSRAKSDLSNAESELRNCQNSYTVDDDGRRISKDCSTYASRVDRAASRVRRAINEVNAAQNRVYQAEEWVRRAIAERDAALNEVEQAKARVALCQKSVALSQEAVTEAREALQLAYEALSHVESSLEEAQSARRLLQGAEDKVKAQEAIVQKLEVLTGNMLQIQDQANFVHQETGQVYVSTEGILGNALQELEVRIGFLEQFAQPVTDALTFNRHMTARKIT